MKCISIIVTIMFITTLSHIQPQPSSIYQFASFSSNNHPALNFIDAQLQQTQSQKNSKQYDPNNIIPQFIEDPKSIPTSQYLVFLLRLTDAYQRLYLFALSDPQIKIALESGQQLTTDQQFKIAQYMVNTKYFQQDILKQLLKKKENSWLKDLSKDNQLKYIGIIGVLSTKDIQNSTILQQVKNRILEQKELGKAFCDFVTENPRMNPISVDNLVITSNYV